MSRSASTNLMTDEDMDSLLADVQEALPDTCTIQRRLETNDGMGGTTVTWPDLYTKVPCRVATIGFAPNERGAMDRKIADVLLGEEPWVVIMPPTYSIPDDGRIVANGATFEIIGAMEAKSWEITRRVICKRQGKTA